MRGGRGKSVKGFLKDFLEFWGVLKDPQHPLKGLFQVSCDNILDEFFQSYLVTLGTRNEELRLGSGSGSGL